MYDGNGMSLQAKQACSHPFQKGIYEKDVYNNL